MKKNIVFVFLMFFALNLSAQKKAVKPLDIYLLIGQSNMAGRAPIEILEKDTLKGVMLFNNKGEWENAVCNEGALNRYSTVKKQGTDVGASPAYSFAAKLQRSTNQPVGIVSNARGGTQIEWWQKGYEGENDTNLYEEAVTRIKEALATKKGTLKAILWHQGEGDNSSPRKELYMQRLKRLVSDLRADVGLPNIPFVAGEVGQWKGRGKGVNPVIRQISDSIPNAYWVTSNGLTSINLPKNDPHFDTFSQRALGGRYADKIMEVVYKLPQGGVTLYNENDFNGRSVLLKAGNYPISFIEKIGINPNEIKSVKLDKGYTVQLLANKKIVKGVSQSVTDLQIISFDTVQIRHTK